MSRLSMLPRVYQSARRLFLGTRIDRKLLVIESDDWGASRSPDPKVSRAMARHFGDRWSNPMYSVDSLESEEDLEGLFDALRSVKDCNGRNAVITANTIVGNPDFGRIEAGSFSTYYFETCFETLKRKRGEATLSSWRSGVQAGLFVPQLHGREHLHAPAWMRLLRAGNEDARSAFVAGICHFPVDLRQAYPKKNLSGALNRLGIAGEDEFQMKYLQSAVSTFRDIFGYSSDTFIAPSYLWNSSHEAELKRLGVKGFQGIGFQYCPQDTKSYSKIFRFTGQENRYGQVYLVRNAFFEPTLSPNTDFVSQCLRRLDLAFRFQIPAIIGSHRVNFVGTLDPKSRAQNIMKLRSLLRQVVKRWPDVEFASSADLLQILTGNSRTHDGGAFAK